MIIYRNYMILLIIQFQCYIHILFKINIKPQAHFLYSLPVLLLILLLQYVKLYIK